MAEGCSEIQVLSPFAILVAQIGAELQSFDVKLVKSLLHQSYYLSNEDLSCVDAKEGSGSGLDLTSKLFEYRLIAPNNLQLLRKLLEQTHNEKLLVKLDKFAITVTELDDAPIGQMEKIPESEAIYLVLSCKKEHLSPPQIDTLKDEICKCLDMRGLTVGHLPYIRSDENKDNKDTTIARFQFPKFFPRKKILDRLNSSARGKETWLTENGVIMLKVNGEPSINIVEHVEFNPHSTEDKSVLAKKQDLLPSDRNVVDVVLAVEMSMSVTAKTCKAILKECESAVKVLSESQIDMNLAVVRFGNHSTPKQGTAFIAQDFCKEFDIYSKLKESGRCGEHGNSGMADALAKVVELVKGDKTRPNAAKVCIMINFLSNGKKLDHYKCNHGNDVIKLANTLADHKLSVYVLGIPVSAGVTDEELYLEDCLLAGTCHIGGGRYLRISTAQVNEMISNVVRNDLSIENYSKVAGDVVRDALNNRGGDVNDRLLAKDVSKDSRMRPLHSEKLLRNGPPLEPISELAKRVDLADDLDDAIDAMTRMQISQEDHDRNISRHVAPLSHYRLNQYHLKALTTEHGPGERCDDKEKVRVDVEMSSKESADASAMEKAKEPFIDLEMASRIAKRHLHRLAYYKKNC